MQGRSEEQPRRFYGRGKVEFTEFTEYFRKLTSLISKGDEMFVHIKSSS
jgi:hypothetical protein